MYTSDDEASLKFQLKLIERTLRFNYSMLYSRYGYVAMKEMYDELYLLNILVKRRLLKGFEK